MADRYRVLNGNWNLANSWSTASGGSGGASVPTASDDVFFDANTPTGTHTVNVVANTRNLNFTGFTGTFTTANLTNIYGDLLFNSTMTRTGSNYIDLYGNSTHNLRTGGQRVDVRIRGDGTFTLLDNWTSGEFNIEGTSSCTFDFNNFDYTTVHVFNIKSGAGSPVVYLRSGTFTVPSITFSNTNLTLYEGTSTMKLLVTSTAARTFAGGGNTFYNIVFTKISSANTGTHTISGSNTFNAMSVDTAPSIIRFTDGTTQTVNSLSATGTSTDAITLRGTSTGGWTISDTSGTNSVQYCNIEYSTANGGANWLARNSIDNGNNSGWIFAEYLLQPNTGTYTYTGVNWQNLYNRIFSFATGSYIYTGYSWLMMKVFTLLFGTGAYTYTGVNWAYIYNRIFQFATGIYTYSGQNWNNLWNRFINFGTGVYTYTGINWFLSKVYILAFGTGSYVYSGVSWAMGRAYRLIWETGVYVYKGFPFWKWKKPRKIISSWTSENKNSSIWTSENKNASSWTQESKNTSTFTSQSKNSSIWTKKIK